jgi:hypothetical protein
MNSGRLLEVAVRGCGFPERVVDCQRLFGRELTQPSCLLLLDALLRRAHRLQPLAKLSAVYLYGRAFRFHSVILPQRRVWATALSGAVSAFERGQPARWLSK